MDAIYNVNSLSSSGYKRRRSKPQERSYSVLSSRRKAASLRKVPCFAFSDLQHANAINISASVFNFVDFNELTVVVCYEQDIAISTIPLEVKTRLYYF